MKSSSIQLQESNVNNDDNRFTLTALHNNKTIGSAHFDYVNNDLHLRWIEVDEDFQREGVASFILNKLFDEYSKKEGDFIVHAVDEQVLGYFYLPWFSKRVDADKEYQEQVVEKFNDLCRESNDIHLLVFTGEDRQWRPSPEQKMSIS